MPGYSGVVPGDISTNIRLDRYAAEYLKLLSRSQVKAKNLEGRINGKPVKISRPVKAGDLLELSWAEPEPANLIPEDLPLTILYEDDRVVVINKRQGMVVHPGAGNYTGTLANALLWRRVNRDGQDFRSNGTGPRPGIVHRLDKDTSGVIIAAYDDEALAFLANQFKERKTRKTYIAIVKGVPPSPKGRIENRLIRDPGNRKRFTVVPPAGPAGKGKAAVTLYRIVRSWDGYSLLLLRPRTGRTHQLRVHLRHLGCPILGDPIYATADSRFPEATLFLHAKKLTLTLPVAYGHPPEERSFSAPLPPRFREILAALGKPQ
ncbi:pseudouridine synthase [Spirochaetia bacterium]|nr:pseudouridine synthase [Spirochaetia bacterium]